ncbi:hypothetical protein Clacol_006808 [Clathrus columnatus]|uniref:Polynucleotide 5'-hydroxyl-kinase GRC3 n=1 Tax=Clathrus columnatus TaxID=1419009 RepID=A0AAV5AKW3_9AGAM|nr:hypothetical protein Clacol_006808 [Clathrus columnatus]
MELNSETNEDRKEWKLEPGTEYRFELDINSSVLIRVSRPSTEYVSEETAMMAYANLHLVFEQMRIKARRAQKESRDAANNIEKQYPRILILGPENSGKTTACKVLANYAARTGQRWTPMLVNLDPNEGAWTIPGTISATPLNMPIPTSSPAYPLGSSATSAPTAITSFALLPIVYWFGHVEMRRNLKLMEKHLHLLAGKVNARFRNDPLGCRIFLILMLVINFRKMPGACGGLIIDTPAGYSTPSTKSGERYPFIRACVDHFKGWDMSIVIFPFILTSFPHSECDNCYWA